MVWSSPAPLREIRDFAEHLDRALCRRELVEEVTVVLEPFHRMREEPPEPAGILRLGLCHVADAQLEVLAVRVDRADHDLIAQNELEVEPVGRYFDPAVSAGDAREDEDTVLAERLHALEHDWGVPGCLEDEVEGPELFPSIGNRHLGRRLVAGAE